ncbi:MAG: DUF368 domain-containing protein [Nitrospira sp. CG24D]|jgi:hypothetical protein|nr:MAG: DUF368 domain-containing protein [Nitrospira sp. CG24D]
MGTITQWAWATVFWFCAGALITVLDPKNQIWLWIFGAGMLISLSMVAYQYFTRKVHTGVRFIRSRENGVRVYENVEGRSSHVLETKDVVSTETSVFKEDGREYITEQMIVYKDGSTKHIKPPKES